VRHDVVPSTTGVRFFNDGTTRADGDEHLWIEMIPKFAAAEGSPRAGVPDILVRGIT